MSNEIKNVLICGLGAIGSIYATKLYDYNPDCIKVLLDKSRYERYKKDGIIFNRKKYDFNYVLDTDAGFEADLIIIATKANGFSQAADMIKNFVGENTIIMSLLNGISSEEVLIEKYGREKVLYSYFLGHTSMRKGNEINFDGVGEIFFGGGVNGLTSTKEYSCHCEEGQSSDAAIQEKVQAVKDLFNKAGIDYQIPEDMLSASWQKFVINIGVNQTLAVLKKPYKALQQEQEAQKLATELMQEAVEIAKKLKIKDCDKFIDKAFEFIKNVPPELKPSMLQDIENNKQTEVEIFAGEVCRLSKKYNISTPKNEFVYNRIIEG